MIVEELNPRAHAEWDAYVDASPLGNCYHLTAWGTVASRAYGHRAPYLVAREHAGGPIRGGLPLLIIQSPIGRYVTNAMFGGYCPVLAETPEVRRALLDGALDLVRRVRASRFTFKAIHEAECPPGFARQDLGGVATLSLEGGPDELWKRFRNKTRNAIRKAQKSDLEVRAGAEELPRFYDVLAQNYHRKGTPIYGVAIMRELCAALPTSTEIVTLWKDGQAISGALVLYHKDVVYVPFCSSRAEHFNLNPNNLIYWEIMRRASARGMKTLDFGRSPIGSSSMAFKLGWGAVETPQPHFTYRADGKQPSAIQADDPWARRAIELWQRLPRKVADRLGPWVHGSFFV
ncbi:MAG: GNAT family N-acetyltransferase [Minicystis sp.]